MKIDPSQDPTLLALQGQEAKQEQKRLNLQNDPLFSTLKNVAKYMDEYYIDPIIGLWPAVGDIISFFCSAPFVYYALVRVRSVPLTLAVAFNILLDTLLGIIPVLGDIFDIFHKANSKNLKLIMNYVSGDQATKREVNQKATYAAIAIAVCVVLIIVLIRWLSSMFK